MECFAGLVGFTQPNDPAYPKIDADLTLSRSRKFIQRTHALCSLENIYNVAPEFNSFDYPAWVAQAYAADVIVSNANVLYKSSEATLITDVPGASAKWVVYSPFSNWLREIYQNACMGLISDLILYKKLNEVGKSLLDSMRLYEGFGMLADKIIKRSRFVGVQFEIKNQETMTVSLNWIGLQLTQPQATLNLYLYHSSVEDPLQVFPITIDKQNTFTWAQLEVPAVMDVYSANNDSSGVFILGYYEDDLAGQAVKKQMNLSGAPCATCSMYNINAYKSWSKHVRISSIEVAEEGLDADRNLFDTAFLSSAKDTNFGMNLAISVFCDLTSMFCGNTALFADALAKRLALDILQEIAFNTRLNAISDKTKALAMAELNPEGESFKREYYDEIKGLNIDFSGFSSECLPCVPKGGIRYKSV